MIVAKEATFDSCADTSVAAVLDSLEEKAVANEAFGENAERLAALLKEHLEAPALLLETIRRRERHERVRWLAIEELAKMQQPLAGLAPSLIEGLRSWDEEHEALTLMGAAIALNLLSVRADAHPEIRTVLKLRLTSIDLRRLDPIRTEMVCQFLTTFGSYAEAEDLPAFAPFWGRGATYTLRLAALAAAARVAQCFPDLPQTDEFFASQESALSRLGSSLIELLDVPENAAVAHATIGLLAARGGPEMRVLAGFADLDPSLARQIAGALTAAEQDLAEIGLNSWLESRQNEMEAVQRKLGVVATGWEKSRFFEEAVHASESFREHLAG